MPDEGFTVEEFRGLCNSRPSNPMSDEDQKIHEKLLKTSREVVSAALGFQREAEISEQSGGNVGLGILSKGDGNA